MKERPILFSAPMVRAILDGKKTQTRRIVKPQPPVGADRILELRSSSVPDDPMLGAFMAFDGPRWDGRCPYGAPGDRLWVRETFQRSPDGMIYRATAHEHGSYDFGGEGPWKPSIFMRRTESHITLAVDAVRVERLQDITEADARAEGVIGGCQCPDTSRYGCALHSHRSQFAILWDAINGERASWASNPWVWVVKFHRIEQ